MPTTTVSRRFGIRQERDQLNPHHGKPSICCVRPVCFNGKGGGRGPSLFRVGRFTLSAFGCIYLYMAEIETSLGRKVEEGKKVNSIRDQVSTKAQVP